MTAADATSSAPTPSPFNTIGPALLAQGFSPIPIRPDGKMPGAYAGGQWHVMRAWSRYCDEFPDPFSMKNWSKWPRANVGVALGKGVIGFDIDREDMVDAIKAVLPPAIVAKRGRKGETLFYRADTSVIKSRGFKIDGFGVMDLISGGKQTVLPPSIHPDTHAPYVWTTERTLADTRPEELSLCTPEHFEAVLAVLSEHGWHEDRISHVLPGERGDAECDNSDVTAFYRKLNEDALANLAAWVPRLGLSRLYPTGDSYRSVAEWRPSNSGKPLGKRPTLLSIHPDGIVDYGDADKGYTPINLVMAAHEMAEFQRDKAVVWLGELLGYSFKPAMVLNRKPKPPGHVKPQRPAPGEAMDRSPQPQTAASAPAEPAGGVEPDPYASDFPGDWPMPLAFPGDEAARTPSVVPIGVEFDDSPAKTIAEVDAASAQVHAPTERAVPIVNPMGASAAAQRQAEMESLTYVPGLVGEAVDWIAATSMSPDRTLAFAAVLPLIGTLAGRLYETTTHLRTNIYTVSLAPAAYGKDHQRACVNILIEGARCGKWLGGSKIASGAAMRNRVQEHPARLWMIDEFGGLMRQMGDERNVHHLQIRDNFLEYFETAGDVFRGADYAGEAGRPCHNPNVSLHGLSTQDDFWKACQTSSASDGMLARLIIFSVGTEDLRDDIEPPLNRSDPPARLTDALRDLTRVRVGGNMNGRSSDGSTASVPMTVPFGTGAHAAFLAAKTDFKRRAYAKSARSFAATLGRVPENGLKIAMIIAIGVDPDKPVITVERLTHGLRVSELCAEGALHAMRNRLADNDRQREHVDVKRMIDEAGWAGIGWKDLLVKLNGRFNERRLREILLSLKDGSKEIVDKLRPTGGRPGIRYVAVENLGPDEDQT